MALARQWVERLSRERAEANPAAIGMQPRRNKFRLRSTRTDPSSAGAPLAPLAPPPPQYVAPPQYPRAAPPPASSPVPGPIAAAAASAVSGPDPVSGSAQNPAQGPNPALPQNSRPSAGPQIAVTPQNQNAAPVANPVPVVASRDPLAGGVRVIAPPATAATNSVAFRP